MERQGYVGSEDMKRYDLAEWIPYHPNNRYMDESDDGDYCLFEEVDAEIAALKERVRGLEAERRDNAIIGQATMEEAYARIKELEAEKKRIRKSLEECLKLQNHYASLLNLYDGGSRLTFRSAQEWINRLQELGILAGKEAK